MSQAQNVTATFVVSTDPGLSLSVAKAGSGSGTVTATNIYCGTICSGVYPSGTSVTLTATADSGSTFSGWSGPCSGAGACAVTMNQAQSVTATFNVSVVNNSPVSNYTLNVSKAGPGSGTVAHWSINCGTNCSASLPSGTNVMLSATADSGSAFSGWSGACSGMGVCAVTMSQAQNVTATFVVSSVPEYLLSVTKSSTGSGAITGGNIQCGDFCSVYLTTGTNVTLTAVAAPGNAFSGWSGACSGTGACTVTMNQAQSVTAAFTLVPVASAGLYDGIYQWADGYYLSVHQIGGGAVKATIYWVYTSNTAQVGRRTVSESDTFDLLQGQIVGSNATISGPRFYRACTLSYGLTFNSDSSLTVRLNSVSNSPGVNATDVDCAARYNPVDSVWTIPRVF